MKLRVARHTTNLDAIVRFYRDILGLEVLGSFAEHENYNGVFLGIKGAGWHLEFTTSDEAPVHQADEDDLLVFYVSPEEYEVLKTKFANNNIAELPAKNPYWSRNGTTYADPDGFGVVIASVI